MRDEVKSDTGQDTVIDAPLHVLGYTDEDGLWWACALELDVLGHGDTFAEALQCLKGVLQAHFEYVLCQKAWKNALAHRAEAKYWRMFYNASKPRIMMQGEKIKEPTYHAVAISQPTIDPNEEIIFDPILD